MTTRKNKRGGLADSRRNRRDLARQIVAKLKPEVHRVRINDTRAIHITIWVKPGLRLEWWPGTERWRDWDEHTHFGEPSKLMSFVREAKDLPDRKAAKPESLIDDGDEIPDFGEVNRFAHGRLAVAARSHMAAIRAEVPA